MIREQQKILVLSVNQIMHTYEKKSKHEIFNMIQYSM